MKQHTNTQPTVALATKEGGKWHISDTGYALVERMQSNGCSQGTIAAALGLAIRTFEDKLKTDDRLAEAMSVGGAALESELVGLLMEKARAGDTVSALFLLKSKRHFNDRPTTPTHSDKPTITINMPAPLSSEAFAEMMRDVTPTTNPKHREISR